MRRQIAGGVLSLALVAGGGLAGVALAAQHPDAERVTARSGHGPALAADPQDVISEDGVTRVFGANRYETAAAIARAYGWEADNTAVVYIASGGDYPDALAIGLSHWNDGPLLLVSQNAIPSHTRAALSSLQPCWIDVLGGTDTISKRVFDDLKAYADPRRCTG